MHQRLPYTYIHFNIAICLIYLQRYCAHSILLLTPLDLLAHFILVGPFSPIDSQDGSSPVHSSVHGPIPSPLTQYVFCVMQWPNLHVQSIVDISHVLPVYISRICSRHQSELSRAVPVIAPKGRVQEAVPNHLGGVIIII